MATTLKHSLRQRIGDRFRLKSIRSQLQFYMLLISLTPLLILTLMSFFISVDSLGKQYEQTMRDNLEVSGNNLDILSRDVETIARQILESAPVTGILQSDANQKSMYDLGANTLQILNRKFANVAANAPSLAELYLYTEGGFSYRYRSTWYRNSAPELVEALNVDSSWYARTVAADGRECYFVRNVMESSTTTQMVSTTKLLRDLQTGAPYGVAVINFDASYYSGILPKSAHTDATYVIVDPRSGDEQHAIDAYEINQSLPERDHERLLHAIVTGDSPPDYLIVQKKHLRTGWIIAHVMARSSIFWKNLGIPGIGLALGCTFVILSIAASTLAAQSISRPLNRMSGNIEKLRHGNLDEMVRFADNDVGRIGNQFVDMAYEITALQQEVVKSAVLEKDAQLRELQAQINPHFLYNTLSSIYWLAKLGMSEEAASAAILLSENFKAMLRQGGTFITVREELDNIKRYIAIQNIRYENRIHVEWNIDERIMEQSVMKLVLQPLVENAIIHGLEPKNDQWELAIDGSQTDEFIEFVVHDNGVGFVVSDNIGQGYGIPNVLKRLRLKYNDRYKFSIESRPGEGTTVTLRIPRGQERLI